MNLIDASDFGRLGTYFVGASARAGSPRPALEAFGDYMVTDSVPKNFAAHGRPDRWPDARRPFGGPVTSSPLDDSGDMKRSVGFSIDANDLWLGAGDGTMPRARTHQLGRIIKAKKGPFLLIPTGAGRFARVREVTVPARPFLVVQDADQGVYAVMYFEYVLPPWSSGSIN